MASNKSVQGIYYDFDKSAQEATVTYRGQTYHDYANEYYGRIIIPSTVVYGGIVYRVTGISEGAFRGCKAVREVVIPKSVSRIGMFAFKQTALERDTNYWENGIMYISQCVVDAQYDVVEGDVHLRSDTRLVADYAFAECEKLRSIVLPDNMLYLGRMAFALCTGLEYVKVSPRVRQIEELTFWACIWLKKVELPDQIEYIEQGAFGGCLRLDSIVLNRSNDKYIVYNGVLFSRDMTTLVCYPAGLRYDEFHVPYGVRQIGAWAFEAAVNIRRVYLPDDLKYIWAGAFTGCELLEQINIPNTVDIIADEAFDRCFALKTLYLPRQTKVAHSIGEKTMKIYRNKK